MKKTLAMLCLVILAFSGYASPIVAQNTSPADANADRSSDLRARAEQVIGLVNGELEPEEIFTEGFLRAVSPEQFDAISRQLTAQFGAAVLVEDLDPPTGTRAALSVRMERAIASGFIGIDPTSENRINELLFQSFEPTNDSLAKIETDLERLSGETSWSFGPLHGRAPALSSSRSDKQMPIGSTFKLYVLATLAREVAEGKRTWSDVVNIGERRSFPSGMMQDWPEAAPVTLHSLASVMISISDNTATDVLIDELGRDAVMGTMLESGHSNPALNDPFLKTREMFLLKSGPRDRLDTYLRGNADLRRRMLDGIEDLPISANQVGAAFAGGPIALDVEWFASADDIIRLMRYMQSTADPEALTIMAINPSMSQELRKKWSYAGYKGGSEPGVLNLSWLLRDAAGKDYALILSWRDDETSFDPASLELIAQRFLSLDR
ncbi:MAG: serine hydrolase [Pseudomonadota bacterium]